MSDAVLSVAGVSKRFHGVAALDAVDLDVYPGQVLGLVGPNGAGKTTLVNVLTGYFRADDGKILVRGEDVTGLSMDAIARRGVTRTFQHLRLVEQASVLDNVLLGFHLHFTVKPWTMWRRRRREEAEVRAEAAELLTRLDLSTLADADVSGLPYGLRRRVEIARALAARPAVLFLDEPTAGMTTSDTNDVGELIRQVSASGVAVVLIEHNVGLVTKLSDRLAVLDWGHLIAVGAPDDVWQHERVRSAYLGLGAA